MNITKEIIQRVENMILLAWPAEIEEKYHSWILRANRGVSKRANSVFTVGTMPKTINWLNELEYFYEQHSIPPCYYISELTPIEVEQTLSEAKYKKVNDMYLLYHESEKIVRNMKKDRELNATFESDASEKWIKSFLTLEGHDQSMEAGFQIIFNKISIPKAFITLYQNEQVIAHGTIAIKDDWGYISNVVVDQQFRRRGYGSQVILQLAKWALENETKYVFLQVLKSNKAGLKLYDHLGFMKLSESHFRLKQ